MSLSVPDQLHVHVHVIADYLSPVILLAENVHCTMNSGDAEEESASSDLSYLLILHCTLCKKRNIMNSSEQCLKKCWFNLILLVFLKSHYLV